MTVKFYSGFIIWFCSLIVILGLGNFSSVSALTEVRDQYYSGADTGADDMENLDNFPMTQSFIPTLDNITKIRLEFAGSGTVPRWIISINDLPGSRLKEVRGDIKNGWVDFVLDSAFSVTPGITYKIEVQQCGFTELGLVYTDPGSYTKGQAETGMPVSTKDYHFETYGYSSTNSGDSRNDDQADNLSDNETTNTSLEPPVNLEIESTDDGQCILLTWDAIPKANEMTGYSIFRSTQKDKNYKEIASLSGDTTRYKDCDLKSGTKYYYKIRSHNGAFVSADSEIASLVFEKKSNINWIYWTIGGGIILILMLIYLFFAKQKHLWPFKQNKEGA